MFSKKIAFPIIIFLLLFVTNPILADDDELQDDGDYSEEIDNFDFLYDDIDKGYPSDKIDGLMNEAFTNLGARYRMGTSGPSSFDCSGFTHYVFKLSGIDLERTSRDQYRQGQAVQKDELQVGDLVFFSSPRSRKSIGHVGIVVEVDKETGIFTFIHASTSFGVMVSDSEDRYFAHRYVGARRVN